MTLVSTAEQQHDHRSDLAEIDPIARAVIDAEFLNPVAHSAAVAKISQTDPIQPDPNLGSDLDVSQSAEPFTKRHSPIYRHINQEFFRRRLHRLIVAYKLLMTRSISMGTA